MWNINQKEYDSPFENTANKFKNDVFEVQAYSWNEDNPTSYNFKYYVLLTSKLILYVQIFHQDITIIQHSYHVNLIFLKLSTSI